MLPISVWHLHKSKPSMKFKVSAEKDWHQILFKSEKKQHLYCGETFKQNVWDRQDN